MTRLRRALPILLLPACLAAPAAQAKTPAFRDHAGLRVQRVTRIDARQLNLSVVSVALAHRLDIRILLPSGYASHPRRRYPVLYLFHGTSGRASDWITQGDAERTTARSPFVVVMPDEGFDGDGGGYFTDWYNGGRGGPPRWETYNIRELVPFVDANLRTRAARGGRAIAGLSQGGFGSLSLAARHPDMFQSVSAFSGAAEIDGDAAAVAIMTPVIEGTAAGLDHASDPDAMFGPRATNELNWQAHDPHTLAGNLRGMDVRLWTGNGMRGPFDPALGNPAGGGIETGVHLLTQLFHARLKALGIPSRYEDYGPGTHTWPYWARDLRELAGPLAQRFARAPKRPARVGYKTTDARWTQWGFTVALRRPAPAFSTLARAGRAGFTLTGTGKATVLTPRFYRPWARERVRTADARGRRVRVLRAGRAGRLRVALDLGPGAARVSVARAR